MGNAKKWCKVTVIMKNLSTTDYQVLYDFFMLATPLPKGMLDEISMYFIKRKYKKGDAILKNGAVEDRKSVV